MYFFKQIQKYLHTQKNIWNNESYLALCFILSQDGTNKEYRKKELPNVTMIIDIF